MREKILVRVHSGPGYPLGKPVKRPTILPAGSEKMPNQPVPGISGLVKIDSDLASCYKPPDQEVIWD